MLSLTEHFCPKKIFVFFLVIVVIFLLTPLKIFALDNGDFESGVIEPWVAYNGALASVSDEEFHGGNKSVKVVNTSTSSFGIQQLIAGIVEGKNYRFSGFIKNTDSYVAKVLLRIGWYKDSTQTGSNIDSEQITELSDWQEISVEGTAPSGVNSVKVRAVLASTTNDVPAFAFFDDLIFEEVNLPILTPTPTTIPTSPPTPTNPPADYDNISISEYMPDPESGDEWVELYNDNDFEVNLNGWYIDDRAIDGGSPEPISENISSKSYKQFSLNHIAYLNNTGDDVRLLNGNQNEKDKTSFETSTKGKSWSKDSGGNWCEVDPTPNSSNPGCPTQTSSTTSTPTPTFTPTPTPTKKVTPTPKPTEKMATESGEILGEEASPAGFYPLTATAEAETEKEATPAGKKTVLVKIFLGLGLLTLFGAAFSLWYTRLR